ncbi:glucose dehydrogenase [Rhodococcus sp. 15-649-2-2]|uniref:PQQ-dependent sugar dehydrogenase n=1 Tax=Rhodococcus sp. 15-649-2-2 TaxID=2023140 RepID=UPI000B9B21D5|nr:PQQ-dependent sugar dehydrogenase [Rhodococcus sp. 15-649-2-2]OZE87766.1 glucose dehydrogenase [Rhodococcus sp. 15-649-2-2]
MRTTYRAAACVAASIITVTLSSCASSSDDESTPQGPAGPVELHLPSTSSASVVTDGLDAPWAIAFFESSMLISERDTGQIIELGADGNRSTAGTVDVAPAGEAGLLGLAVRERDLYTYSTAADGNRIDRFDVLGAPGSLALGERTTVLDGIPAASYHDGGRLAFGPDGMLYATTGDAGQRDRAQDLSSLAGKILRITPEGAVPPDNPYPDSFVYSYGHRNPQGIAWDANGVLYASEFGANTWDELNRIEPGSNYGWPQIEGIGDTKGFVDPIHQWATSEASPSGIAIDGSTLFMANLRGERMIEVDLDDPASVVDRLVGTYGRLRDVTVAPDGSLLILTNNTDGRGNPNAGDDRLLRFSIR